MTKIIIKEAVSKKKKSFFDKIAQRLEYPIKKMEILTGKYKIDDYVVLSQKALMKAMIYSAVIMRENKGKEVMGILVGYKKPGRIVIWDAWIGDCYSGHASTEIDPINFIKIIKKAKEKNLKVLGWWHCLPGNELVYTEKGPIKIEELDDTHDKILVYDSDKDKYHYSDDYSLFDHTTNHLIKIRTKLGRSFTATRNHTMPLIREGILKWITMNCIKKGDNLCIPEIPTLNKKHNFNLGTLVHLIKRPNAIKNKAFIPRRTDKDLALFLGLLFSDGHIRERAYIGFTNKNQKNIDLFSKLTKKLFGLEANIRIIPDGYGTMEARFFSREVFLFLKEIIKFDKKHILSLFYSCNKSIIKSFVDGLIIGDGNTSQVSKKKKEEVVSIYLGTKQLSIELIYLLSLLGIKARIRKIKQNFPNKKQEYVYGVAYQKHPTKLSDLFPIGKNLISREKLNQGIIERYPDIQRKMKFVEIIDIEDINKKTKVYDIFVPKHHTFIAGHGPFISHNSHPHFNSSPSGVDTATNEQWEKLIKDPIMLIVTLKDFFIGTTTKGHAKKLDFVIPPTKNNKIDLELDFLAVEGSQLKANPELAEYWKGSEHWKEGIFPGSGYEPVFLPFFGYVGRGTKAVIPKALKDLVIFKRKKGRKVSGIK